MQPACRRRAATGRCCRRRSPPRPGRRAAGPAADRPRRRRRRATAVTRWTGSAARVGHRWQADRCAAAQQGDAPVATDSEPARVRALERGVGVGVRLAHVIGAVQLAGHGDHHALRRPARGSAAASDRVAQVLRAVVRLLRRRPHRADHDHRLGRQRQQVPGEGRLLDDVRALHDDRAVDLGPRQLVRPGCGRSRAPGRTRGARPAPGPSRSARSRRSRARPGTEARSSLAAQGRHVAGRRRSRAASRWCRR